jgi:hypothetical protein
VLGARDPRHCRNIRQFLNWSAACSCGAAAAAQQAQVLVYGEMQRQAAMLSFIDVFWILGSGVPGDDSADLHHEEGATAPTGLHGALRFPLQHWTVFRPQLRLI